MMKIPTAILGGLALVALAVYFRPQSSQLGRYQAAPYGKGWVVRLDTRTGALMLCGNDKAALAVMTTPAYIGALKAASGDPGLAQQLTDLHLQDVANHSCVAFFDPGDDN